MRPPAAWAVQTREGHHCIPPPRLWQRRPRNVLLVTVLLLLLGSRRVYRGIVSVPVERRVKSVGPSHGNTIIIIISRGLLLLSKISPVVVMIAVVVPACNVAV